mmetsp:Transcript_11479/g.48168  ORF Transcript_11479/g.48168 Transcript_11479/m.48168 type:complete len:214 (-) Transcript_11479:3927-4568(-)
MSSVTGFKKAWKRAWGACTRPKSTRAIASVTASPDPPPWSSTVAACGAATACARARFELKPLSPSEGLSRFLPLGAAESFAEKENLVPAVLMGPSFFSPPPRNFCCACSTSLRNFGSAAILASSSCCCLIFLSICACVRLFFSLSLRLSLTASLRASRSSARAPASASSRSTSPSIFAAAFALVSPAFARFFTPATRAIHSRTLDGSRISTTF